MPSLQKAYPYFLGSKAVFANQDLKVTNKYTGEVATTVAMADADVIDKAIDAAEKSQAAMTAMRPYERQKVLDHCVKRFNERFEELAYALCIEAGKPIKDARGEVTRLIDTFRIAAEESVRIQGEVVNLEITERAKGYTGMYKHVPIGPCSFISPFNFPLNLAAHKVAPAIAAGCTFVLKPASRTPLGAIIMGEVLAETDLPEGAFSILPCSRDGADLFTTDDRFKLLSFTGSPDVGWDLKARAGKKPVILELGGNAACVIDEDADIDDAIERVVFGAYYQSGQSCISVQRILVHEAIYAEFKRKYTDKVSQLVHGDPLEESTFIGPMIAESEAERLENWINEAVESGATLLCGGKRKGAMLEATVLENAPHNAKINAEEAFGPVSIISSFNDYDEALARVNDSQFGLQAGVFTRDIYKAHKAWDVLDVGGVVIGDVPSWRVDNMPYGGVKESGLGREGIRYAIADMTEIRLMVLRNPNP
ncbi:aldehyde dehydrogenase family protein [Alteromonas oceanisediminis]|uniref:aldehyde dehydrogenase family protein n=1 Tax=Alteromonas oceanisediminis TaxID=2836180 RepID=UPI001BD9240C|nr:aldehyde dehydrogenase family protein [Alteromonas oceanisediminis]MBT0586951.1 aldehyde dehydrogenase family protein [Alteromonas oceanisediminis]